MITGLLDGVKSFLRDRLNLGLVLALVAVGAYLLLLQPPIPAEPAGTNVSVHFFYMPACPHCHEQWPIIDELRNEYPEVYFAYHDVSRQEEMRFFINMAAERGLDTSSLGTPTTIIGSKAFVGVQPKSVLEAQITTCIDACKANGTITPVRPDVTSFDLPLLGKTNLTGFSLPVLAVVLGLIDGFNPCAMWVLVYLIAVVAQLNDRARVWLIVGSFVFASGALYFLFMTAWLNAFLMLGYMRPVAILVGLGAVLFGISNIREYVESHGRVTCKIVDGKSKKSTMNRINELAAAPLTWATVLGIIALAFVVNSIEFVCSSAIPAVFTQVLALSHVSTLEHYGYILLYDFFFMLDDVIIFGMAAFALAGGLGEKYAGYCKILGGLLLLAIGAMLLFAPNLLA